MNTTNPKPTSFIRWSIWACCIALLSQIALAQQLTGHYPVGVEGIKAATLPPPGHYTRDYNLVYFADRLKGGPPNTDFDVTVYANVIRQIWVTDCKILGANYGMDLVVPFVYTDFKLGAL